MRARWVAACLAAALAGCAKAPSPPAQHGLGTPVFAKRSLWSRWSGREFDRSLMTDDHRAVALPLDAAQLSDVRTGDRIDVISVFDASLPRHGVEKVAATILQDVEVLGVRPGSKGEKGVLTLRLNPIEAQYAALALKQSELFVAVRNEGDVVEHPLEMATFRDLFH